MTAIELCSSRSLNSNRWVPRHGASVAYVWRRSWRGMHNDKNYETANRVEVFDRPSAICWKPGQISPDIGEMGLRRVDVAIRPCTKPAGVMVESASWSITAVRRPT